MAIVRTMTMNNDNEYNDCEHNDYELMTMTNDYEYKQWRIMTMNIIIMTMNKWQWI